MAIVKMKRLRLLALRPDREQLLRLAQPLMKTEYGQYLQGIAEENR